MATPNNLPAQLSSFVGRERQLAELRRLLRSSRLVTLTGPGGAGKTRLAIQLAAGVLDSHRDGVWLVDLAAVTDARLLEQSVASAIGVREQRTRPIIDVLVETLARNRVLIVLDGCEHLVEPCADLVSRMLRSCPRLTVIVTSREPLGLPGEVIWRTPSLTVPAMDDSRRPELLLQSEAVRLFIDRARLSRPALELDPSVSPTVAQICARLEGIPLAIELAAGLARVLTFDDILARLSDRFRLLTGGSRTALPRHQTLRQAVDWSYGLLSADEKELLIRLSVFVGGFDLSAAEAVAAGEELDSRAVLPLLSRLVDKSLVVAEEGESQRTRYRMLDTIREYAQEKLQQGNEAAVRQRHSRHFVEWCGRADKELRSHDQLRWLRSLDEDQANVRIALEWSLAEQPEDAMRLVGSMERYWAVRGHLVEALDWLDRAIDANPIESDTKAVALHARARFRWLHGDYASGRRDGEACVDISRRLGLNHTLFKGLNVLGILESRDNLDAALHFHEEAFQVAWQLKDPWWVASSLNNLGIIALMRGDHEVARGRLEQAITGFGQAGDRYSMGLSHDSLARVNQKLQDYSAARRNYGEALTSAAEFHDSFNAATCLEGLAELELIEGRAERALQLISAAQGLREAIGAEQSVEWKEQVEGTLAAARTRLGRPAADAAWRQGAAMGIDDAMRYATGATAGPARDGGSPLTGREKQVALLIADGLTNPEIAGRLHMAERTADAHVEHIRNKLGLRSRSQIAVWAHERLGTA